MSSIEVAVIVKLVRPKSVLVSDTNVEVFIPRSQILNMSDGEVDDLGAGEEIELEIPEWLAIEKELV